MFSPLNLTTVSTIPPDPMWVCARKPPWHKRFASGGITPMPAWRNEAGFLADGPLELVWMGRRWDLVDKEYVTRPRNDKGGTLNGYGSCNRIILAQNVIHDGEQLIFDMESYYEMAPRPFMFTDPDVMAILVEKGMSPTDFSPPVSHSACAEAMEHADEIAMRTGGYIYKRPFRWPTGDIDLCKDHAEILYGMPSPDAYGKGMIHTPGVWPSPVDTPGFFAWRVSAGVSSLSALDLVMIFRRAWSGSPGAKYGFRYSSTKAGFLRDLPPYTAFDIRIWKTVYLSKSKYRGISKESQASYFVAAYRASGALPKSKKNRS